MFQFIPHRYMLEFMGCGTGKWVWDLEAGCVVNWLCYYLTADIFNYWGTVIDNLRLVSQCQGFTTWINSSQSLSQEASQNKGWRGVDMNNIPRVIGPTVASLGAVDSWQLSLSQLWENIYTTACHTVQGHFNFYSGTIALMSL